MGNMSTFAGIAMMIPCTIFLAYLICYVFKYNWVIKWLNKWAKVDFVPEKRWNKLLLNGFIAILASSAVNFIITGGLMWLFSVMYDGAPAGWCLTVNVILSMIIPLATLALYGYYYIQWRQNKEAITTRQGVWEMVYGVVSIWAIAAAIVAVIWIGMVVLMVIAGLFILWLVLTLIGGESVKVKTGGLFSSTKTLHKGLLDNDYHDSMGNTYERDGDKFYEK